MKYTVIGITDAPTPYFPPEVLAVIQKGRLFSGGRRHHDIVAHLLPPDAQWIDITAPLDAVFEQYHNAASVIVFASGDPLFFGFASTIRRREPDADVVVYPTFNSLQMLAHRLLMPYHDMRIISLTGRPWPELDRALIERTPKIGILTDHEHTPAAIACRLLDYGYNHYTMHVGEHLGNPTLERVTTLPLAEAATASFASPNCVILAAVAPGTATMAAPPFGLPDASFALLDGREKMITKMPVRLLTLQALDLPSRHTLWDIGFCTGSVSIEARLLFPHLRIDAFEVRPECEAIIRENARRHGAPGINVHIGDFLAADIPSVAPSVPAVSSPVAPGVPAACSPIAPGVPAACSPVPLCGNSVAAPDAVFIGGHGGRLKDILAKVLRFLAPGGVIVMNSVKAPKVLTDSHQLWDEACRDLGLHQEPPLRIVVDNHHPIEILKATRQA